MSSKITTNLAVDAPIELDAKFNFDKTDRRYIDDQARGAQQHLVDSLLSGVVASWYTLDNSSAAVSPGHVVCLAATAAGTVTKGVLAALTAAKGPLGVVLAAATPGARVWVAVLGRLPTSTTGLAAASGYARVNTTTAYAERVDSLQSGDYALGTIDAAGNLAMGMLGTLGGALGALPSGTVNQVLQNDGSAWVARNDLIFPAGSNRYIKVANGSGDAGGLLLYGADSATGVGGVAGFSSGEGASGHAHGTVRLMSGYMDVFIGQIDASGNHHIAFGPVAEMGSPVPIQTFTSIPSTAELTQYLADIGLLKLVIA